MRINIKLGLMAGSDMHDPGMPSNHAQFSFFLCVYFSAYLMTRYVASFQSGPIYNYDTERKPDLKSDQWVNAELASTFTYPLPQNSPWSCACLSAALSLNSLSHLYVRSLHYYNMAWRSLVAMALMALACLVGFSRSSLGVECGVGVIIFPM